MTDKEFYERLRKFLDNNMGAFFKWNTDIGELNELGMEVNKRLKEVNNVRKSND